MTEPGCCEGSRDSPASHTASSTSRQRNVFQALLPLTGLAFKSSRPSPSKAGYLRKLSARQSITAYLSFNCRTALPRVVSQATRTTRRLPRRNPRPVSGTDRGCDCQKPPLKRSSSSPLSRTPSASMTSQAATPTTGSVSTQTLANYRFPTHRLKSRQSDPTRTPLVLVACGSFSPVTYLHLRMFEIAADFTRFNTEFEVIGGYLSPVSDAYKKAGLASSQHRLRMCELAVDQTSNWLMVDPWEAIQTEYMPTALVLDHVEHEINEVLGGVEVTEGVRRPVRIALLAGADLIQTMSTPGVWSDKDLDHILGRYGTFIVERTGTDIDEAISNLSPWKDNIWIIQQLIQNDVSSTKIRLFLRREMSVRYLIPNPVIEYIEEHGLYEDDGAGSMEGKGKTKGMDSSGRGSPAIGGPAGKS